MDLCASNMLCYRPKNCENKIDNMPHHTESVVTAKEGHTKLKKKKKLCIYWKKHINLKIYPNGQINLFNNDVCYNINIFVTILI